MHILFFSRFYYFVAWNLSVTSFIFLYKVLELSSQGYSEREISEILKVSDSAVHRDLVFIRRQAKENLQKHETLVKALAKKPD